MPGFSNELYNFKLWHFYLYPKPLLQKRRRGVQQYRTAFYELTLKTLRIKSFGESVELYNICSFTVLLNKIIVSKICSPVKSSPPFEGRMPDGAPLI
jgi:hypothetical protein